MNLTELRPCPVSPERLRHRRGLRRGLLKGPRCCRRGKAVVLQLPLVLLLAWEEGGRQTGSRGHPGSRHAFHRTPRGWGRGGRTPGSLTTVMFLAVVCMFGVPCGQHEASIHFLERAVSGNRRGLGAAKNQVRFKNMFALNLRMQQLRARPRCALESRLCHSPVRGLGQLFRLPESLSDASSAKGSLGATMRVTSV